jgi:hypothetical protein
VLGRWKREHRTEVTEATEVGRRLCIASPFYTASNSTDPRIVLVLVLGADGRMVFVREGQHDSSQTRSAWTGVWTDGDG